MSTTADLFTGDLLAPDAYDRPAPDEDHPFPPAPHIDLGDGYTQPPLPGF